MTEEELTNWEHRPDVIRVLTSYEMGAWLHRRDKRLLQEIRAEIEEVLNEPEYQHEGEDWGVGLCIAQEIIDKYRGDKNEVNH